MFLTRRRKRNVKRKHDKLDFDKVDDDLYFSMVCEESSSSCPKRRWKKKKSTRESPINEWNKETSNAHAQKRPKRELVNKACDNITAPVPSTSVSEITPKTNPVPVHSVAITVLPEKSVEQNKGNREPVKSVDEMKASSSFHPKIRVKTAAELGMCFIFVEDVQKVQPKVQNLLESAFPSGNSPTDSDINNKLDLKIVAKLYKKYFTNELREKIRYVAKMLRLIEKYLVESKSNLDRITKSKCSDAEKLMLRCQTHSDLSRKIKACQTTLKEQLTFLDKVDDLSLIHISEPTRPY